MKKFLTNLSLRTRVIMTVLMMALLMSVTTSCNFINDHKTGSSNKMLDSVEVTKDTCDVIDMEFANESDFIYFCAKEKDYANFLILVQALSPDTWKLISKACMIKYGKLTPYLFTKEYYENEYVYSAAENKKCTINTKIMNSYNTTKDSISNE